MTVAKERLKLAWRVAPATISFILEVEAASRNARNLVDGLMLAAILAANVSAINNDPDLQIAYATLADAPPEDLRRPVSISAIAHSMRMPFETVRRRIQAMVRAGVLEVTPKGVLVASGVMRDPRFVGNAFVRHELLKAFYFEMKALGAAPVGSPGSYPSSRAPPLRLTNRLLFEYMLRAVDALSVAVGDATNGVLLLAMVRRNTDGFESAEVAAWAQDPMNRGLPVRNGKLASELNLSTETLRRYVIALEAKGFCMRGRLGLLATEPPGARPALDRLVLGNLTNVQRLFGRLSQLGALSEWEAPERLASGAA
ncbi:MAG TPA: hypothetical protein VF474_14180 [Phenylobacterium sp.]